MIKVLLVDDDEYYLKRAARFLGKEPDIDLCTSNSPEKAIALVKEKRPDVVLSDYQMPIMNGIDLFKNIRDNGNDVPFVILTDKVTDKDELELDMDTLITEIDFHLEKTDDSQIHFDEISHVVRNLAARRRAERKKEKILSSMSELVAYEDTNLRILWANEAAAKSVNRTLGEIIGKHCWEIWGDGNGPCSDCPTLDAIKTGEFRQAERRTPDGRHWFIRANPIEENGEVVGVIEISLETTDQKTTQQRLEEREEWYKFLFENTGCATFIADEKGNVTQANKKFSKLSGYSKDDLDSGLCCFELFSEDFKEKVIELRDRQLSGKGAPPSSMEIPLKTKEGELKWTHLSISMIPEAERLIISIIDLPIDDRSIRALARSEERHRKLFNNTGTIMVEVDKNCQFRLVNDTFCSKLGYTKEEVEGKMTAMDLLLPQDHERWVDQTSRIMKNPESGPISWEQSVQTNDGRTLDLFITGSAMSGSDSFIGSAIDLTDIRKTEKQLSELQDLYSELVENANSIIMRTDRQGHITFLNRFAQKFFGYNEQEILGKHPVGTIIPTESSDGVNRAEMFESILINPGKDETYDTENVRSDGERVWVAWTNEAITDQNGNITGVLFVGSDITEKKEAEKELKMINKKLDIMSAITRHDIVNQLAIIEGYGSILQDKMDDLKLLSHLEKISKGVSSISAMIAFQREYELIGKEGQKWFNVEEMVQRVIRAIDLEGMDVEVQHCAHEVLCDSLMDKVFHNLVGNSLRHGGEVRKITISCSERESELIITYQDDGGGVPTDKKKEIFLRGVGDDTGYGLYLVSEILNSFGMSIKESGQPGEGAMFEITVPNARYKNEVDVG